jgi:hypothetical protein
MVEMNLKPSAWVEEMLSNNIKSFYRFKNNKKEYYNISQKKYCQVPGQEETIQLEAFKENDLVWTNKDVSL